MVQHSKGVFAGFARHVEQVSNKSNFVNISHKSEERYVPVISARNLSAINAWNPTSAVRI